MATFLEIAMLTLYKGEKKCTCDKEQLAAMEKAGWSKTKPEAKAEAKADAPADAKPKTTKKVLPKRSIGEG